MQRIRLKRTHPDAELPVYKTEGSAGFDLAACETVEIPPSEKRGARCDGTHRNKGG